MKKTILVLIAFLLIAGCSPASTPTPTPASTALPTLTLAAPTLVPSATLVATFTPTVAALTPASSATVVTTPPGAPIQTPAWFRNTVLYEIFPRSFYDSNGDGIGDLAGIIAKLDYLQQLGIGAIWLTPIFASPSYHGYDTTDYYKINPDFGTEADLVALVQAAHQRRIRILLDYVVAHTSNEHPFFKDAYGNPMSKYAGWYRWTNPEHTTYESFAGVKEMPTLNHDNPEVQAYLIDVAKYWMKTGIDGYRADYVLNVPHPFWKKLRAELKAINPDFLLLAEAWTNARAIQPYYDAEFDAAFDFPLYGDIEGNQDAVGDSFLLGTRSPRLMDGTIKSEQILFPPGSERVEFLNNHDTNRVMSEVKGDILRAKLGAALLLTLPNTPMIYYGEEIGMSGIKAPSPDYDKTRREPMDWYTTETGPGMTSWYKPPARNNKPNDGISVQEENTKAGSLLEYYRTLVDLRNANPVLRTGAFQPVDIDNDQVYAFARTDGSAAILVLQNYGSAPAAVNTNISALLSRLPSFALNALSKQPIPLSGSTLSLTLDPLSSVILEFQQP